MSNSPLEPSGPEEPPDFTEILRSLMSGDLSGDPAMADALKQMGLDNIDPAMMQMVGAQLQAMMSGSADDGSFNAELATDIARKQVSAGGDKTVSAATERDVEQVVQVANLWLDQVTDFPVSGPAKAASRAEWVEATMPLWRGLVEPVAAGVSGAIRSAMRQQFGALGASDLSELGLPPGIDPSMVMGQMEPVVGRMSAAMFGMQVGQAVGALAGDLVTGTEVGLPLVPDGTVMILPANVAAFAEGLHVEAGEVHLYLAVREAARMRLFGSVGWLGPALIAAVQKYAGDISIDTDAIEQAVREADTTDPQQLQGILQNSLFSPEPSDAQTAALDHLQLLLALVEGWVDEVSERAVTPHLPNLVALSEAVRRRRAAGGPAERVFASLVGLQLRPRLMREAASLFAAVEEAEGAAGRDESWRHPDFAPTALELPDPGAYLARRSGAADSSPDDVDDALAALLAQGQAEWDAEGDPEDSGNSPDEPEEDPGAGRAPGSGS